MILEAGYTSWRNSCCKTWKRRRESVNIIPGKRSNPICHKLFNHCIWIFQKSFFWIKVRVWLRGAFSFLSFRSYSRSARLIFCALFKLNGIGFSAGLIRYWYGTMKNTSFMPCCTVASRMPYLLSYSLKKKWAYVAMLISMTRTCCCRQPWQVQIKFTSPFFNFVCQCNKP